MCTVLGDTDMARKRKNRRRRDEISNRRLPPSDPFRRLVSPKNTRTGVFNGRLSARQLYLNNLVRAYTPVLPHRTIFSGPMSTTPVQPQKLNRDRFAHLREVRPTLVRTLDTTCQRRSKRTQVLHALRKTGKVGQKRPRWTDQSYQICKRKK